MEELLTLEDSRPIKLTVEDYVLLAGAGAFDAYRRTELIEGVIIEVNAELRPHARVKNQLMLRLSRAIEASGLAYEAFVEPTLALPPVNMPEPDVMVARYEPADDYFRLEHAMLVAEVGASSLRTDLGPKRAIYAEHGVPEYWVVDVEGRRVHQFWSPADGAYRETRTVPLAGELRSATLPALAIDGAGIL